MVRPATARLKVNPPLGRMPVLQFCSPNELRIDPTYQRDVANGGSQALIRRIAQHWNWDLCQPLVVARRTDFTERLFVIDGQHRLEAARLRGDIAQLPCVVVAFASPADEAASFVHLNQQRRPLTGLDLFKAALASDDPHALAIKAALDAAGLSLAAHMSSVAWKPGQLGNIGGIQAAWRLHGAAVTGEALQCLAVGFAGKVLRYAGTLFPGIVAVCAEEVRDRSEFAAARFAAFTAKLGSVGQDKLRQQVIALCAERPDLSRNAAAVKVISEMWNPAHASSAAQIDAISRQTDPAASRPPLAFKPDESGHAWCEQCDMRVTLAEAEGCRSPWCSLRKRA